MTWDMDAAGSRLWRSSCDAAEAFNEAPGYLSKTSSASQGWMILCHGNLALKLWWTLLGLPGVQRYKSSSAFPQGL